MLKRIHNFKTLCFIDIASSNYFEFYQKICIFYLQQEKLEHRNAELLDQMSDVAGPGPCLEKESKYNLASVLIPQVIKHFQGPQNIEWIF